MTDLTHHLEELDAALTDFRAALTRTTQAATNIAEIPRLHPSDVHSTEEEPNTLWLNAYLCINPADSYAVEVGRTVIRMAMQERGGMTIRVKAS